MAHHQRRHLIERVTHYLGDRCPGGNRDDVVEDGHGLMWVKCGTGCDLHVVAGEVQCSCPRIDGN